MLWTKTIYWATPTLAFPTTWLICAALPQLPPFFTHQPEDLPRATGGLASSEILLGLSKLLLTTTFLPALFAGGGGMGVRFGTSAGAALTSPLGDASHPGEQARGMGAGAAPQGTSEWGCPAEQTLPLP